MPVRISVAIEAPPDRAAALRRLLDGAVRLIDDDARVGEVDCLVMVHEPPERDAIATLSAHAEPWALPVAVVLLVGGDDRALRRDALRAGAMEVVPLTDLEPRRLVGVIEDAVARAVAAQRPRHLIASAIDVTARARAEQALRKSEEQLRRVFETNLLGILDWDLAGRVHDANDELLRIIGHDRAELEAGAINWARITPAEYQPQDERALDELRRWGKHAPIEKELVRKDGTRAWVLVGAALAERDRSVGFVLDITAQKRIEEALRESELRALEAATRAQEERRLLDAVLEAVPAGILVADRSGRLLRLNPANELLWGPAPWSGSIDEYRDWKGWWAAPADRRGRRVEPHEWAMARALRGESVRDDVIEIEPFDRPGTRRTLVTSASPVRDPDGRITGGVVAQMDITALVAAEAAHRETEARFRALADNITQLAWMTDETGYVHWYNRRWFEFTGAALEDVRGWGWQALHHPDHVDRVVEKLRRHLALGEPWEDTFPLRGHDGQYRWFLSRAVPLRDESGRVVSWFGTNTDITAQRDAEATLREADRRKDELIATLAHELRNPLAPIRTAVQLLRMQGPLEPPLVRARDAIDRQVTHMARLIDDLLDASRISSGKLSLHKETCDLAALVIQTAEDHRASLEGAGLTLVAPPSPAPIWVEGDPVRLVQMIGNLLHNAERFTERGGGVEVRTEIDPVGGLAVVTVADTGVGMDPALLSRLFDPFSQAQQDLARSKGGLGLGLALTKGLAELHGGGVAAHSEGVGRGSTFSLRIPLSRARHPAAAPGGAARRGPAGLQILVVDDNQDAAELLGDLLGLAGHHVRIAFDGTTAVRIAKEQLPDVVISDLGLPGEFDGYAVARAIRADPTLERTYLIALSGYAGEESRRRSQFAGYDEHYAKPMDLRAIERALSGRARVPRPPGPPDAGSPSRG